MVKVRFTHPDDINKNRIITIHLHNTNGIVSVQYRLIYDKLMHFMQKDDYIPTAISYNGIVYDFFSFSKQYKQANNLYKIATIATSHIARIFIEKQLDDNVSNEI